MDKALEELFDSLFLDEGEGRDDAAAGASG